MNASSISARRPCAFTVAETVVATAVLGLVMALVFGAVIASNRMFHQATLRAGLQSDVVRLSAMLERDGALSDFWRAQVEERITVANDRRDGMALVGLSDWGASNSFDPTTSLPRWDRYIVYYATMETPARLVRQVVSPGLSGVLGPYGLLGSNLSENPATNDDVEQSLVLSQNVDALEVGRVVENGRLTVRLRLKKEGGRVAHAEKRVVESLETTWTVRLKNTWPRV